MGQLGTWRGSSSVNGRRGLSVPSPWLAVAVVVIAFQAQVTVAQAGGCRNEQIRARQSYAEGLSDCRAYEQVSPAEKNGLDAEGETNAVQASPFGEGVTFFTLAPFVNATPGSNALTTTYLSIRNKDGELWETKGLLPQYNPVINTSQTHMMGLTQDLAETIVVSEEPPLVPGEPALGAGHPRAYVENDATGAFQLLADDIGTGPVFFVDASSNGSRILFESTSRLTPNAEPGVVNLYEWNETKPVGERVSLAGVLPNGKGSVAGSVAGPGGPLLGFKPPGGSKDKYYTQGTISTDGSRIFFSDAGTGFVYMREPEDGRTVLVSAGNAPAFWRNATPDGKYAFYTEGNELYRFNVEQFEHSVEPEPKALAEAREQLTTGAEGVLGTLGISKDGTYVYFVAKGLLAVNSNSNGESAEKGANNLYVWHAGSTVFIAKLVSSAKTDDQSNWAEYYDEEASFGNAAGGEKTSRVTPDGKTLLFSSVAPLTGYNNGTHCEGEDEAHPCFELFLYSADANRLRCVSCNPLSSPATRSAYLGQSVGALSATPAIRNSFLKRNLSSDGSRVFFQTEEALVPEDNNGQWDVYEWEQAGRGTCTGENPNFNAASGGCLSLISTGTSSQPSYLGDADESGDNVFFFTRQSLVDQDQDANQDLYDARVDGGISGQNLPPQSSECEGEACRGSAETPPGFSLPGSESLAGSGNLAYTPPVKATAPKKPKSKKALPRKPKRRHRVGKARTRRTHHGRGRRGR